MYWVNRWLFFYFYTITRIEVYRYLFKILTLLTFDTKMKMSVLEQLKLIHFDSNMKTSDFHFLRDESSLNTARRKIRIFTYYIKDVKMIISSIGNTIVTLQAALILLWIFCCLVAVFCLSRQCEESKSASSPVRKSFHFLIFIVFLPGLIIHPCLMYVASGIALALLILIEVTQIEDLLFMT